MYTVLRNSMSMLYLTKGSFHLKTTNLTMLSMICYHYNTRYDRLNLLWETTEIGLDYCMDRNEKQASENWKLN